MNIYLLTCSRIPLGSTILCLMSLSGFGQSNLNASISSFSSCCLEVASPEESLTEFRLVSFESGRSSTEIQFEILANCAQTQKGTLLMHGDTLIIITETDVRIGDQTASYEKDSLGNEIEITTFTQTAEMTFCDCLIAFSYKLATNLKNVNYISFHGRTFRLADAKKQ